MPLFYILKRSLIVILLLSVVISGCSSDSDDSGGGNNTPQNKPAEVEKLSAAIMSPARNTTYIMEGQSVQFLGSTSGGEEPISYAWNFGGAADDVATLSPGQVSFPAPGTFEITFTATDAAGDTSSQTVIVTVIAEPDENKIAALIAYPASDMTITAGDFMRFQGSVIGGTSPYTYAWHFGGGAPDDTVINPGYVPFNTPGVFTITFTAADTSGSMADASMVLTVLTPPIDDNTKPTPVLKAYGTISAGSRQTVARKTNGTLWNWGDIWSNQLGAGPVSNSNIPIQVGTKSDWNVVAAGEYHAVALKVDGTLWAWGSNQYNQLGNATSGNSITPVQVGIDHDWCFVVTGEYCTIALKTNGTLWAWGYNDSGRLGIGSTRNADAPVQVGTDADWSFVAAGQAHVVAIKKDGSLWGWGNNKYGQLGIDTYENVYSPIRVGLENDWDFVAAGHYHTVAHKTNGTLWAWGYNGSGQLGSSAVPGSPVPEQIGAENNWDMIAAGGYHSIALKTDGTLWTWGDNQYGQLGKQLYSRYIYMPVQVGSENDWDAVAGGTHHSAARKKDGRLWAWGSNEYGQLGIGKDDDTNVPTRIYNLAASIISPEGDMTIAAGGAVNCKGSVLGSYPPFSFLWDFDGGAINKTQDEAGPVIFKNEGIYRVTFRVTDAEGVESSQSVVITVTPQTPDPPKAVIISPLSNTTIVAGEKLSFKGNVTEGTAPFHYFWDFDGGATAVTDAAPRDVLFSTPGTYSVTLKVTDQNGKVGTSEPILIQVDYPWLVD